MKKVAKHNEKRQMNLNKIAPAFAVTAILLAATSCKTPENVAYFQDTADVVNIVSKNPVKVRPEDKLTIIVKSKDPEVSSLFNMGVYSTRHSAPGNLNGSGIQTLTYNNSTNEGMSYYTVDPQGYIDFPILGKLKVEGMTRSELAGFIKGELMGRDLVKDPTVTVEFVNTGFNVLGEVSRPGRYDMNVDHMNVLEAISLAGDLSINGMRENVKVLREENGQVRVYKIDLTDLDAVAKSPAYYLQQNDIVYVEPNDIRKRQTTVNGNNTLSTSFWISVASLITTAVTTVGVFVTK